MKKNWNIKIDGRDMDHVEIIEALMESRGIKNYKNFLNPPEASMIPFEEMSGLEDGCDIILKTLERDGKFVVLFDVDGNTAGAIMTRYLQNFTNKITTYINEGKKTRGRRFSTQHVGW